MYSGTICYSSEGCVELDTTYDPNVANSDVITMEGKTNTAIVSKDYTQDFLVDVTIPDISDSYTYLVFDRNITGNYSPLYEANISKASRSFSAEQSKLDRLEIDRHIHTEDIDRDGKLDIAFTTFDTDQYTKAITVVYDAKSENDYVALEYDFEYLNDDFTFTDINGDNKTDIVSYGYNTTEQFVQQADGTFTKDSYPSVWGDYQIYNIPDFNNDMKSDLVRLSGCALEILHDRKNENNITSIPLNGCAGIDNAYNTNLRIGDFDHDGNKDFLITYQDERDPIYNGNTSYFIVLNNNDGTVTELDPVQVIDAGESLTGYHYLSVGENIIVGDINEDGYDDFILNGHIFLNNKNNTFKQKIDIWTNDSFGGEEYLGLYDINKDGMKDIVFSGYLGIRAILIYSDYNSREILLSADGDQRNGSNIDIGQSDIEGSFDIVRNYNNAIEFISFEF